MGGEKGSAVVGRYAPAVTSVPDDSRLVLRTERLELTPLTEADAPEMFEILRDPNLGASTGEEPPASVEALRVTYAVLATRRAPGGEALWLNWIVRERTGGPAMGFVQATVTGASAHVAWVIGTAFQRQGYASEAAAAMIALLGDVMGVEDVVAAIPEEHEASQGVARRLGLTPSDDFEYGERLWRTSFA